MQAGEGGPVVRWMRPAALRRALDDRLYHGYGWREYAGDAAAAVAMKVGRPAVRRHFAPSLVELSTSAEMVCAAAEDIMRHVQGVTAQALAQWQQEYVQLSRQLQPRYSDRQLSHPRDWCMGDSHQRLLYYLVRLMNPDQVMETGVANGHASYFILSAMRLNGRGLLTSTDIKPGVGALIDPVEAARWRLQLLDPAALEATFAALTESMAQIELFVHDADHSYKWQMFEYQRAWKMLRPGGVLISHDVDWSYAFMDFCRAVERRSILLVDGVNTLGLIAGR